MLPTVPDRFADWHKAGNANRSPLCDASRELAIYRKLFRVIYRKPFAAIYRKLFCAICHKLFGAIYCKLRAAVGNKKPRDVRGSL